MRWTDWKPLYPKTPFTESSLRETLDGGQAFRWKRIESENIWEGIWGRDIAQLTLAPKGALAFRFPEKHEGASLSSLNNYLLLDTDWARRIDQLPWRSDPALKAALEAQPGLRLLNQPFPEALLCFLCSATKQIPQIKIMCENLAREIGSPLFPKGPHALPTWDQLSHVSEAFLRGLGLGFRAKNIKKTADLITQSPGILETIEALPYAEAKAKLLEFPGVGSKIADCALLFGAQKYEAFPVDTWILKSLRKRYGLDGWSNAQMERFGRVHLGADAGYAQQFLFAYERANA